MQHAFPPDHGARPRDGTRPLVVIPDDITGKYGKAADELAQLRAVADVVIHDTRPTADDLAARIRDADIVLSFRPAFTRFPAAVLEQCPRLRFVCIAGVGVEDVDVPFASAHGIAVGNVVGSKRPVAEHCLALMLDVARRVTEQDRAVRAGEWKSLQGIELGGKTLGIVGLSGIAREFAPLARGIGMEVLSWSRDNGAERAAAVGAVAAELDDVLARADVLSLHLRLFPELAGFMNAARFARMKEGAIFLNTARGELVDDASLVAALVDGRLRGAGLDVFAESPLPADHALRRLPNVVLTPSSAWNTVESSLRGLRTSIANVLAFIDGRPASITNTAALAPRTNQEKQ